MMHVTDNNSNQIVTDSDATTVSKLSDHEELIIGTTLRVYHN